MLDEYKSFTRKTAVYPKKLELPYLVLGLISEVIEYLEETNENKKIGELGDIFWYVFRLIDHFGFDVEEMFTKGTPVLNLSTNQALVEKAGYMASIAKKIIRGDNIPVEAFKTTLSIFIDLLHRALSEQDVELSTVLISNTAKLQARLDKGTIRGHNRDE